VNVQEKGLLETRKRQPVVNLLMFISKTNFCIQKTTKTIDIKGDKSSIRRGEIRIYRTSLQFLLSSAFAYHGVPSSFYILLRISD